MFKVEIDGKKLGLWNSFEGLGWSSKTEPRQEGGENHFVHELPGRLEYTNVKISRPLGRDSSLVADWLASMVTAVKRTTAVITAVGPDHAPLVTWTLDGVVPVRWTGPSFNVETAKMATETLELAYHGFIDAALTGRAKSPDSATQGNRLAATLTVQEPKAAGRAPEIFTLTFPFNPSQWSVNRTAGWKTDTTKKGVPPPEFKGPNPASVSIEIFLDESGRKDGDISKTAAKLEKLVHPEQNSVSRNKPSGPHVLFEWGKAITFKGYVESVAVKYTMFRSGGTPIRGTCTLGLKEFPVGLPAQNPSSGGLLGSRTHRVVAGDTLASVAYAEYGDPTLWRKVADANPDLVDDPMRIPAGAVLRVPPA